MLTNQEPDRNIEDLTEAEIYELIRYLEPNPQSANEIDADQDKDSGVVICVCLYIALMVCLAFVWFYWR